MVKNLTECDEALRKIALIDLLVSKADTLKTTEQLEAETRFTNATSNELKKRKALADDVEAFYKANRKTLEESGKRSRDLNFGRIGFRKGKPKLMLLKGWKWEKVIETLKGRFTGKPILSAVLTETVKPNKEGIKSQFAEYEAGRRRPEAQTGG